MPHDDHRRLGQEGPATGSHGSKAHDPKPKPEPGRARAPRHWLSVPAAALALSAAVASLPARAEAHPASGDARVQGASMRASGVQITPDRKRALISKDVGNERWAITRNDDGTVTGNVFRTDGGAPVFIYCEETDATDTEVSLSCESADACAEAPCSEDEWTFLAEVTLPLAFFEPPAPTPLPDGPLGRRRFSIDPAASFVRSFSNLGAPVEISGFEGWLELEAGEADPATGIAIVDIVDASPAIAVEGFAPGVGPMTTCIVPLPGQFPIANAGVIDCNGGTDVGYALTVDHDIGVVGVGGFTAEDCAQAGGTVEPAGAPHPGVCNGAFSTSQLGGDSGPGALILAPDLIVPGGAFNVRITNETALPCGDEDVPAFEVPIALTTARTTTTILDERGIGGSTLETETQGENFSCAGWAEEDGPGALTFTGFALDYELLGFPGLFLDAISVYYLHD